MQGMIKLDLNETVGRSSVVGAGDVWRYPGWRVAAVFYTEHIESKNETEHETDGYGNRTGGPARVMEKTFVVSEPRFLLVQSKELAVEKLTTERDTLQEAIHMANRTTAEYERKAAELEEQLKTTKQSNQSYERSVTLLRTETDEHRTRCRKLEGDIGKIRTAIGEKQMKEILASTVNT